MYDNHDLRSTLVKLADDTNLFLSHQNINTLFKIFNEELKIIGDWFKAKNYV